MNRTWDPTHLWMTIISSVNLTWVWMRNVPGPKHVKNTCVVSHACKDQQLIFSSLPDIKMNLSSSFRVAVSDTTGMVTLPSGTVASLADTMVPSRTCTYCDDIIWGMVSDWLFRMHCLNVAMRVSIAPATGDVSSDTASSAQAYINMFKSDLYKSSAISTQTRLNNSLAINSKIKITRSGRSPDQFILVYVSSQFCVSQSQPWSWTPKILMRSIS